MEQSKNHNEYPHASQATFLCFLALYVILLGLSVFVTWQDNGHKKLIATQPLHTRGTVIMVDKMRTSYHFWVGDRLYNGSVRNDFNDPDHICVTYYKNNPAINTGCDLKEDNYLISILISIIGGSALLVYYLCMVSKTKKAHLTQ